MKLDECSKAIIVWLRQQRTVCLDDLICERLIADYSDNKIIQSLNWLKHNGLICCKNNTDAQEPYLLVPGGVEYSADEWCLSELGAMVIADVS
jgi:hypothetical protein